MKIQLSPAEVARDSRPVRGQGGFQTLLRRIAKQISGDGVLTISESDLEKLIRYSFQYGQGGFQGRTTRTARRVRGASGWSTQLSDTTHRSVGHVPAG
jgi:hypothetical protein